MILRVYTYIGYCSLVTQLVGMFATEPAYSNLMMEFMERLCSMCLNVFQASMCVCGHASTKLQC